MAGGGYRGILAAVPPTQHLRSASGKGAADQDQDQKPKQRKIKSFASKPAPTGGMCIFKRLVGCQAAFAAMRGPDKPAPTKNQSASAVLFTTQQAER
jgi:hypothetical protein